MSRRLLKAASAIREVVSMAILTELRDPRVQNVTVVGVEVAPDMRSAKVAVSIMGAENKQKLTLDALQRAAGFLQSRIADRIDTRYTPKLTFVMDKGSSIRWKYCGSLTKFCRPKPRPRVISRPRIYRANTSLRMPTIMRMRRKLTMLTITWAAIRRNLVKKAPPTLLPDAYEPSTMECSPRVPKPNKTQLDQRSFP